jgi:hypothetical protein
MERSRGQAHALVGHAGASPGAALFGRASRPRRKSRENRGARRRRGLRGQGHRLSRGRRPVSSRHASRPSRQMGRAEA